VRAFGAEVAPTLPDAGLDAGRYVDDLVARFRNPAMHHLLRQIGSDGSLKIPERWLPALRELRAAGASTPVLELALAGWVAATGPDPMHDITDPAAAALHRCWVDADLRTVVAALLRTVGATDLAEQADLVGSVAARLPALRAGRIEL
jgi:fructuronate reductase